MVGEENNDLLPEVSVLVAYVMLPNLGVNVMWYYGTVRYRSIQEYVMLMGFLNTIYIISICIYTPSQFDLIDFVKYSKWLLLYIKKRLSTRCTIIYGT